MDLNFNERGVGLYLVRWKLIWSSGKVLYGRWGKEADRGDTENQAWCQNKEGLAHAMIEKKDLVTKETTIAAQISGPDFCNFEWMGRITFRGKFGEFKPAIVGLTMVCRSDVVEVYNDGTVRHRAKVLPDNMFHYGK